MGFIRNDPCYLFHPWIYYTVYFLSDNEVRPTCLIRHTMTNEIILQNLRDFTVQIRHPQTDAIVGTGISGMTSSPE